MRVARDAALATREMRILRTWLAHHLARSLHSALAMKTSTILGSVLLSIVALVSTARADGETCGGFANLQCPSGEMCVAGGPGDQTGTCESPAHHGCDAGGSSAPTAFSLAGVAVFVASRRRRRA